MNFAFVSSISRLPTSSSSSSSSSSFTSSISKLNNSSFLSSSSLSLHPKKPVRHVSISPISSPMSMSLNSDMQPVVPILMGSASDMGYCQKIANALSQLGVASELRVASAHKVPARLLDVIAKYEADPRPKVYIGVAGRSNALSGLLDCAVSAPVISCPPPSESFGGADIFSSLRMPSGVAPAVILEPKTAALFATKILAVYNIELRQNVARLQKANRDRLYVDDVDSVTKAMLPKLKDIRQRSEELLMTETTPEIIFGKSTMGNNNSPFRGKVRDRYEFSMKTDEGTTTQDVVALVTTDRQSAFDRVLAAVPCKGAVLNLTSSWWFKSTQHIIPNHVISVPHPYVTVAHKCTPFPVEFVVRGYITGSTSTSLWKNYESGVRQYCGIDFPDGLKKHQKLAQTVLTPTTKADIGDEPISGSDVVAKGLMSQADWDVCSKAAMRLFEYGQQVASENGLILVDTKYEFGRSSDGTIRLIDEVHTPDSSRFWISATYEDRMKQGKDPENVDKEFLRVWFKEHCDPYDMSKKLPEAPDELVEELGRKYIMLFKLITGEDLDVEQVAKGKDSIAEAMKPFVERMVAPSMSA